MDCPHCGTHIDEHSASYCLNAWVAADVMELAITYSSDWACFVTPIDVPTKDYSGSIAAAWEVVEKLAIRHPIEVIVAKTPIHKWGVTIWHHDEHRMIIDDLCAETAPLAICRAAIKACNTEALDK